MSALQLPTKGLVTAQGFRPVVSAPPLVNPVMEAEEANRKLGSYLAGIEIAYNDLLVLKYVPDKIGNLLASAETQKEQRWQNKCGLILKIGPTSKQDGLKYDVGDWVYYRPSDGQEIGLKCENDPGVMICLILSPAHIIGRVSNPDLIW